MCFVVSPSRVVARDKFMGVLRISAEPLLLFKEEYHAKRGEVVGGISIILQPFRLACARHLPLSDFA